MTAPLETPEPQTAAGDVPAPDDADIPPEATAIPHGADGAAAMVDRHERVHPNVTIRKSSPNFSSRTEPIGLIVIHATESPRQQGDLANLGGWFGQTSSQVSAHIGTDQLGESGRYVDDVKKAWHVAGFNSAALGIEQVGHTTDGTAVWEGHNEAQICETARWVARWSKQYDIPIRKAVVSNGKVVKKGVCRHSELGTEGGNHGDPGPGYPMARMLEWARHYRSRI